MMDFLEFTFKGTPLCIRADTITGFATCMEGESWIDGAVSAIYVSGSCALPEGKSYVVDQTVEAIKLILRDFYKEMVSDK